MLEQNDDLKNTTRFNVEEILDLARLCLSSTAFQWNDKYYKQIHGNPMSSSIPVVLAEITLQSIETHNFNQK